MPVVGRSRSAADAIRGEVTPSLGAFAEELRALNTHRPACSRDEITRSERPDDCDDEACSRWLGEVTEWARPRYGQHVDLVVARLDRMASTTSGAHPPHFGGRAPLGRGFVEDVTIEGGWILAPLRLGWIASKADAHELVEAIWPSVERLQRKRSPFVPPRRAGRLDRPARMFYWWLRRTEGLSDSAILDEWEELVAGWLDGTKPDLGDLHERSWREWQALQERRGRRDGDKAEMAYDAADPTRGRRDEVLAHEGGMRLQVKDVHVALRKVAEFLGVDAT